MRRLIRRFQDSMYFYCGHCGTWIHVSRGLHPHDSSKEQA
jgi:hypothetical protein